jgi:hypothetical protein
MGKLRLRFGAHALLSTSFVAGGACRLQNVVPMSEQGDRSGRYPVKLRWRQEDRFLPMALYAERTMPTDGESAGCQHLLNG